MKNNIISTIEITDFHIKLLQATANRGDAMLVIADTKGIAQPNDQELSKDIKEMCAASKMNSKYLIGVIPRRFAILRHVTLPSQAPEEIKKMIDLQVTKQVPYPKEDIVLDYIVTNKDASGYADVLVVAAHKEVLERYYKIFEGAGLHLSKLTLSSQGLINWQVYQENKAKQKNTHPMAIVNVDSAHSEIAFYHQQKLLYSRSISFGAKDLNAEKIAAFLEEISLTLATYTKESIGEEIVQITLVSCATEIGLLKEKLSVEFKLPVTLLKPTDNVLLRKNLNLPLTEKMGVSLCVGLGLVLDDSEKIVDLMPKAVSGRREVSRRRQEWAKFISLIFLVACLCLGVLGVKAYKRSSYLWQLQKNINASEPAVSQIKEKIRRLQFIKERLNPSGSALDVIRELYNLTPTDVSFITIFLDESGALVLQGVAQTSSGVNTLQKNLASSPFLQNVALQYSTKRKVFNGELTDFKITCQILKAQGANKSL